MASLIKFLILLAGLFIVFFGCVNPAPPVSNVPVPNASANVSPKIEPPVQNVTPPPLFKPIQFSYTLSVLSGPGKSPQNVFFNYYLMEKTECGNRPALNGFVKIIDSTHPGPPGYSKITVYLDSGEAVYSNNIGQSDLAFNTTEPHMIDFDPAFWSQTIIARGSKSILADEFWNGTAPVLLQNIAAFGANGDYSVMPGNMDTASNIACKNLTVSVKSSSMEGQIITCIGRLNDVNLTFIASAAALDSGGGPSFKWVVNNVTRDAITSAYYSQCLSPISCPSLQNPTQSDRNQCSRAGKSIDIARDANGCAASYDCITNVERAQRSIASSQNPSCPVSNDLVNQTADCLNKQGNVNYNNNPQTGCITGLQCGLPPQNPP